MGTRGRRSSAELSTKVTVLAERRPAAPVGLTEAEAGVWRDVVNTMPGGWLTRAQWPLLAQYCRHVCRSDLLAQEAARFEPEWMRAEGGLERLNKLLGMAERESKAMTAVARALRLTPASQYTHRKGATINAAAYDGPRPWEPE